MAKISLYSDNPTSATSVSNIFIDEYMSDANGEFVKIYLYLLRLMNLPDASFSISSIADKFDHTEKDVKRALCYWERMHLLRLEYNANNDLTGVHLLDSCSAALCAGQSPAADAAFAPAPAAAEQTSPAADTQADASAVLPDSYAGIPAEKTYSPNEVKVFRENEDIAELFFIIERYLGRPLSPTDIQKILFLYDGLHFSTDLIEYLVESCVGGGHKSMPYIYKTAFRWAENHITTVEEAKQISVQFNRSYYTVMNSLGLSGTGRSLTPEETGFLKKWTNEYGFSDDLIAEACRRTIDATSRPSFKYTDSILTGWHNRQVRHLSDVAVLDAEHAKKKTASSRNVSAAPKNKFNNFTQRTYDYDELEQMLLTGSTH